MKILSLDVGIKNLAFCLFVKDDDSSHFTIKKWDIINVTDQENVKCCINEKNIQCDKIAKFKKNNNYYCLKHSKKQCYQIPTADLKPTYINKQKIQVLHNIADKYKIQYEQPMKKQTLLVAIHEYIQTKCLEPIETVNCSKVDLINIGINIKNKFNALFGDEDTIDYVIIENQISPIANRMKTIQGMISQYFIMSNILVDNIEFISASNKLKEFIQKNNENKHEIKKKEKKDNKKNKNEIENIDSNNQLESENIIIQPNINDKTKYNERKKMGIEKTLETLNNEFQYNEWIKHFKEHKKKDDLADSFLQGLWFIKNKL